MKVLLLVAAVLALGILAGCTTVQGDGVIATPRAWDTPSAGRAAHSAPFGNVSISSACDAAMQKAADVPGAEVNDNELVSATAACSSLDEWASALRRYPKTLGGASLNDDDAFTALVSTCKNAITAGITTQVCDQATAAGYMQ